MDKTGLVSSIYFAAIGIDAGRKGFATRGKEQEGRILFETGIAEALTAFKEAQLTADPQTIILAEYSFITQELEFCKADKHTFNSLTQAIQRLANLSTAQGGYVEKQKKALGINTEKL